MNWKIVPFFLTLLFLISVFFPLFCLSNSLSLLSFFSIFLRFLVRKSQAKDSQNWKYSGCSHTNICMMVINIESNLEWEALWQLIEDRWCSNWKSWSQLSTHRLYSKDSLDSLAKQYVINKTKVLLKQKFKFYSQSIHR